jgi:hypothetical protein
MLHPDKKHYSKPIQIPKGFQIEYFINMVAVFLTCAHTLAHSEWSAWGKRLTMPKGKMKNKKVLVGFHYCRQLCPHHLHSYCQICPMKQSLKGGKSWEKFNSGIAELSIWESWHNVDFCCELFLCKILGEIYQWAENKRRRREVGFAVSFPHSIVQGHQENA